jgi:hypothetical protein
MTSADAHRSHDVTAQLRIARGSTPISGSLQTSTALEPFVGWVELSALIERIRAEKSGGDAERRSQ